MKKLDISSIAAGISMYVKAGTLQFLQLAYQEVVAETITSRIGKSYDTTKGYIINGCINTGSGTTYNISAGSVFFNGEIFLVDAANFTITGSNVAEGVIITTQYVNDADPTDFTDGVQRNVHNIRKIVLQPALAGSGAFDYVNRVDLKYRPVGAIGQTIIWNLPSGVLTDYFNTGTNLGIHPLTLDWQIDTTVGGHVVGGYKNGDAVYGTVDAVKGSDTYQILATDLPQLETDNKFENTPGGSNSAYVASNAATLVGNIDVNKGSPNNPISLMQSTIIKLYITRYQ